MTRLKFCGLSRPADIEAANRIRPDYAGFVFAARSRRCVTPERAASLKRLLAPCIRAVGVFVDEAIETVAALVREGVVDAVQLHGSEDAAYIEALRTLTHVPIIRAYRVDSRSVLAQARESVADDVMLDAGAGEGRTFDWTWLADFDRPYFLAGGLTVGNAARAVKQLAPYALDVSSGIETDGVKDEIKMAAFAAAVRAAHETNNQREK